MIPKIIHYCWFGKNPKPKLVKKCIKSWKKYCSGYKIVEWNESNFNIRKSPTYVQQAYDEKKWAFVSDYVRLYVLFQYGGIYMDTDVEVVKKIDRFLKCSAFSGFENETSVPTGIIASVRHQSLLKELLAEYDNKLFYNPDGSLNLETNVTAITRYMMNNGLKLDNTTQNVGGFVFFPKDYFCPKSYNDGKIYRTKHTHTIHHFAGSWKTSDEIKAHKKSIARAKTEKYTRPIKNTIKIILGERLYNRIKMKIK